MKSQALYPHQEAGKKAITEALLRGVDKQLVVIATGGGKTKLAADVVTPYKSILWLTHRIELINQSAIALLSEELSMSKDYLEFNIDERGGLIKILQSKSNIFDDEFTTQIKNNIGIIKEDLMITDKRITIASIQTAYKRLDRLSPDLFDVIVVDEAHRSGAKSWTDTLSHFNPKLRLGLTATPWRSADGMQLADIFDEIVYEYPIDKAINDGFLCKPDAIQLKTSANLDGVKTNSGDFKIGELVEVVNSPERNNLIVTSYLKYAEGRKFIAFCANVQHTIDLCECFNERGIKANFIVGDKDITTDRIKEVKDFKTDDSVFGLINCDIATEGFDFPNTGCVILATPTKSKTKFMQQLGRGTRLKDEAFVAKFGQNCILLDVVDNTTKHKLINTFTLDKDLPVEKKVFISEKNRQMLLDVKFKREHSFTTQQRLQDVKVDLFQLPKVIISESLRMKEAATEKQLAWIASLGYDVVGVHYTKLMCSEIISLQSASDKQIYALGKLGYDMSNGCTVSEAKLAFEQVKEREQAQQLNQAVKDFKLPFNL